MSEGIEYTESPVPVPPIFPQNAVYTSCWCEENIYLLGRYFLESQDGFITKYDAYVVVISNEDKSVAICQAKSCSNPDLIPGHSAILWDYHVVLVVSSKSMSTRASWVYDFDSRLPMGCSFGEYIRRTFPPDILLSTRFQSWFRVVQLQNFIDYFASDRSHMLRSMSDEEDSDSVYMMPPPAYPPLQGSLALAQSNTNNLFSNYVDMRPPDLIHELCEVNSEKLKAARYGIVVSLETIQLLFLS